jgi:hypothetical protein
MLQIMSMVLQLMTTDEARFDDEHEMSVMMVCKGGQTMKTGGAV